MNTDRRYFRLRFLSLFFIPTIIGGIGLAITSSDSFVEFREYVRGKTIPEILVKSGRTGKELRLLEYESLSKFHLEQFEKDLPPSSMPSTRLLFATAERTLLPTLSIAIDAGDLLDRNSGIIANYSKRGRSWERPAFVSYFENGDLQFALGAGVRVHGGKSRAASLKSYRLYFRELYGSPSVPNGHLFRGRGDPIRSLVVHNDVRTKESDQMDVRWHFMNPLAYDLARQIDCITPSTQPIQFYLNGIYQGPYVLTEHISEHFLTAHFGHPNFVFVRMKPNKQGGPFPVERGNPRLFDDLRHWTQNAPAPLTVDDVNRRVDLLNLTNWIISILYAGVTDPFQGAALLDELDPNARWFWVNWDMDHAFMDLYNQVPNPWEIDNFTGLSGVLQSKKPRSVIFERLRRESAEYRQFFLTRITEVLNHILTPEYVAQRIAYYESVALSYGVPDTKFLEAMRLFSSERPAALRRQMDKYFDAGNSYRLTVSSRSPIKFKIDGYDVDDKYVGWYFEDTEAQIEVEESSLQSTYTWNVNGRPISERGRSLVLSLTNNINIEIQ
ncbi:MAG: CotH kinase family protein [Gammaproteobacteria bacterium]|nr:CotH kinase family protein [Gammaproteobacteria bacterium]